MTVDGAIINKQGVTFGVLVVDRHELDDRIRRDQCRRSGQRVWGALPIVLMAQDARGAPIYEGPEDLSRFLAALPVAQLPIRRWSTAA
jgi:hypothetical protein